MDAWYRDLQRVERDFRTLKTGLLELRLIFVRKENRTRGHVFAAMLALKVTREGERGLKEAFGTTEQSVRPSRLMMPWGPVTVVLSTPGDRRAGGASAHSTRCPTGGDLCRAGDQHARHDEASLSSHVGRGDTSPRQQFLPSHQHVTG